MSDSSTLEKLAKIHRHMVSAKEIGSEAEAQAFAGMLQRLLAKYRLSMTDVEYVHFQEAEPIKQWPIDYTKYPDDVKVKGTRVKWSEDLAYFVAQAYNCRIFVHSGSNRITLVGRKTDAEIAEWMYVKLVRTAEKIADREYVKFFYECRDKGEVYRARGFRKAFLSAFVSRIARRFDEERAKLQQEHTSTALVRVSLAQVDEFIKKTDTKSASALSRTRWHPEGTDRGRKAADAIDLGQKGMHGREGRQIE